VYILFGYKKEVEWQGKKQIKHNITIPILSPHSTYYLLFITKNKHKNPQQKKRYIYLSHVVPCCSKKLMQKNRAVGAKKR
jgi:ADP-dependent phosphofructokinase/glucokinase